MASDPLQMESQAVAGCLTGMLGIKLRSSGGVTVLFIIEPKSSKLSYWPHR
jgi:hypothetical protein